MWSSTTPNCPSVSHSPSELLPISQSVDYFWFCVQLETWPFELNTASSDCLSTLSNCCNKITGSLWNRILTSICYTFNEKSVVHFEAACSFLGSNKMNAVIQICTGFLFPYFSWKLKLIGLFWCSSFPSKVFCKINYKTQAYVNTFERASEMTWFYC